jgi:hypothetical protein
MHGMLSRSQFLSSILTAPFSRFFPDERGDDGEWRQEVGSVSIFMAFYINLH